MKLFSGTKPKVFSLLSIGQRGVGKTVFLAGSYAELRSEHHQENREQFWFDCRDSQTKKNIESILNYVARTGQYPPPTMKIINFNLSLKHRSLWGAKTLCNFQWRDIPGECCKIGNTDFQKMVLNSHGCCVFINAYELVRDPDYLPSLEELVKQVVAISSLVKQHGLKYPFALIFTQCDRLDSGSLGLPHIELQIEENLEPLISRLDAAKAKYQKFYSAIPIVSREGVSILKAKGVATPLFWLVSELKKIPNFQSQSNLGSGLKQGLSARKLLLPTPRRYISFLALAGASLLAVVAFLFFVPRPRLFTQSSEQIQTSDEPIEKYQQVLRVDPNNLDALHNLAGLYLERGQLQQAIPLFEKIVQQHPDNLEWHLTLAKLYALTGQKQKAEITYDEVLAQQKDNFTALLSKAVLRGEQGDIKTARALFQQAEKVAPTSELKAQVRTVAQSILPSTVKPLTPAQ